MRLSSGGKLMDVVWGSDKKYIGPSEGYEETHGA